MYELNKKIYIFDFDGTLVDSMSVAVEIVLDLLREYKIVFPDNIVDILTPMGFKGIAKYYAEVMGVPMSAEEVYGWFTVKLKKAYAEEISLKPTAKETLKALKMRGAKLAVLTASPHAFVDPCLQREGVFDWFDKVWSSEDFSTSKGDVALYDKVAKEFGVPIENLVMVDDCFRVIKTAKSAGVGTVGVYDSYSAKEEVEMRKTADKYVYALLELIK